ncbi:MAG: hypothetical protein H6707_08795 [Deltaproteobacteria bacterium]|nr:hypothetical protein [Deltaproteobacteria bacterium]
MRRLCCVLVIALTISGCDRIFPYAPGAPNAPSDGGGDALVDGSDGAVVDAAGLDGGSPDALGRCSAVSLTSSQTPALCAAGTVPVAGGVACTVGHYVHFFSPDAPQATVWDATCYNDQIGNATARNLCSNVPLRYEVTASRQQLEIESPACPPGTRLWGGGCRCPGANNGIAATRPSTARPGWLCRCGAAAMNNDAFAVCSDVGCAVGRYQASGSSDQRIVAYCGIAERVVGGGCELSAPNTRQRIGLIGPLKEADLEGWACAVSETPVREPLTAWALCIGAP